MSEPVVRVPPDIEEKINRLLDVVEEICGGGDEQHQNQFALLLTTLGAWIEHQPNPEKWIGLAIETLRQHQRVAEQRS